MRWLRKKKKEVEKNVEQNANEKVLVLYFGDAHGLICDTWTLESLWNYMKNAYKTGEDPYALGKAEVWGMKNERNKKYGR